MNFLSVKNLCFSVNQDNLLFRIERAQILKDITFDLSEGELLGIAGESGSGKTTLVKLIAGLQNPTSGTIHFNPRNNWGKIRTKPIQILFQNSSEILNPLRKVEDMLSEVISIRFSEKSPLINAVIDALKLVGLSGKYLERRGYELSGGEMQRVALARIVSAQPEILILDEPFSAQDADAKLNFVKMIKKISIERKITIICISHELKILKNFCHRIMILHQGSIAEINSPADLFSNPQHEHTKYLISTSTLEISD